MTSTNSEPELTKDNQNPAKDNNNVNPTTTSEGKKQPEPTTSTNKTKNKRQRRFVTILSAIILFAVLITGITAFAHNGEQTYLSSFLDSTGRHRLAFLADTLRSNNKLSLYKQLSNINDANTGICSAGWKRDQMNQDPLWAVSGEQYTSINLVNPQYTDDHSVSGYFKFNLNLKQQKSYAGAGLELKTDLVEPKRQSKKEFEDKRSEFIKKQADKSQNTRVFEEDEFGFNTNTYSSNQKVDENSTSFYDPDEGEYGTTYQDYLSGFPNKIKVTAQGEAIATVDGGYLNVPKLEVETDTFRSNNSLVRWYKQAWDIDNKQKDALKDNILVLEELLRTNPADVVSEDTGKQIVDLVCTREPSTSALEIGKYGTYNIETGTGTILVTGRKFTSTETRQPLKLQDTLQSQKKNDEILEKALKDPVFKSFLFGKYDTLVRVADNFSSLSESSSDNPSKQEYEDSINSFIESQLKEIEQRKNNPEQTEGGQVDDFVNYYNVEIGTVDFYLNSNSEALSAVSFKTRIKFNKLDELDLPKYLSEYIKDGIEITSITANVAYNDDVPSINVPADSEVTDASKIVDDLKLEETFNNIT